mgnify:FL=1
MNLPIEAELQVENTASAPSRAEATLFVLVNTAVDFCHNIIFTPDVCSKPQLPVFDNFCYAVTITRVMGSPGRRCRVTHCNSHSHTLICLFLFKKCGCTLLTCKSNNCHYCHLKSESP